MNVTERRLADHQDELAPFLQNHVRRAVDQIVSLTIRDRRELCIIKNISAGGMMIRAYCPIAEGTPLSIELKNGQPVNGKATWVKEPNVGVTWNSNDTDVRNGSVAEYFKLLRPWIKSCHINELHSGYPYRELFRLFRETGYDRVTLCEVGRSPPDAASGEDMLRYYKALWTELARA